ncbi:MAG: hypothetical protein M1820_003129 [Bogoriella megaspora]|nr:MAG: hypothetical protein M1820_003129 [Bogoriella megaspora]
MSSQPSFLPPFSPIEFSLTKGTSIPSPPATPPKPEPITKLPSRPPTPGRGPLNSHPTTPVDLDNLPASPAASQTHTPTTSPPPGMRARQDSKLRNSSYDMLNPSGSQVVTTVSSPVSSNRPRPQNKRSFLGLRRLSGTFDSNIRYSNDEQAEHEESPRPSRPFSPVAGFIGGFKTRSRTSSFNTGTSTLATEDSSSPSGNRGLRKKKSASWFKKRMSGMPLGIGVETVEEGQVNDKGDDMEVVSPTSTRDGFHQGGYVTDLEKAVDERRTPPPQLPDLGSGMGEGRFASEDLFGSIR